MHVVLLPGMDGTGRLFEPLLRYLPSPLVATAVSYPRDKAWGYSKLLPLVEAAIPSGQDFIVLGESFSGPLAVLLAARRPNGLRGVILCASFVRNPLPSFVSRCGRLIQACWIRRMPTFLAHRVLLGCYLTPELRRMVTTAIAEVDPQVMAARARAVLSVDVSAEFRTSGVPILYLAATEDRLICRRNLDHVRSLRPDTAQVFVQGPHMVLQANPKAAASVILSFVCSCLAHRVT
jgi:pimeloyl-[acyl-carrier protein] methyl ester esterase